MPLSDQNSKARKEKWSSLLEQIFEFDQKVAPHGLYGIRDYNTQGAPNPAFKVEWELLLKPAMNKLGCNSAKWQFDRPKSGIFLFQETAPARRLQLLRVSKIKVRKYGNTYRVDPHHEFEKRWKQTALDSVLDDARKWTGDQDSLVLLLGFAAERTPFAKEIDVLQSTQTFNKCFEPALTKIWDDPHGRGFKVIAALWIIRGNKVQ